MSGGTKGPLRLYDRVEERAWLDPGTGGLLDCVPEKGCQPVFRVNLLNDAPQVSRSDGRP